MKKIALLFLLAAGCGSVPVPSEPSDLAESCGVAGEICCFTDGGPTCDPGLTCAVRGSLLRCEPRD